MSLNGKNITNNSYVDVHDIGINQTALLCNTDKTNCCGEPPNRAGKWYFPSGTEVKTRGGFQDEFYRDRGRQVVRLHHRIGTFTERGLFRCEVPDADDIMQSITINIGMISMLLSEMQ